MSDTSFPQLNQDNNKVALVEGDNSYSYAEVNQRIDKFATGLLQGKADLQEERVAFFYAGKPGLRHHHAWRLESRRHRRALERSLGG